MFCTERALRSDWVLFVVSLFLKRGDEALEEIRSASRFA